VGYILNVARRNLLLLTIYEMFNEHKARSLRPFVKAYIALLIISLLGWNTSAQTQPSTTLAEVEDLALTLVTLKSPHERESLLARKKGLMTPELRKALIRKGNAQLVAGRYSTAFDIYGLAQNVAEQIGDREGVATAWLDIGTVYYFQANYPAALEHYKKARELFLEVTNHYESAKALSGLALIYKEQRRDTEALTTLQQVLKEFNSLGDKEEVANTLNMIGTIHYGHGNYSAAAEAFSKSRETNNDNTDSFLRLADALYMQGDYPQALIYYKQTLERISGGEIGALVASINGAANSAYYIGNYDEALQHYQRGVAIQKTQLDKVGLANALKGIGNVHRARGDYGAALESYFNSLNVAEQAKTLVGGTLVSIGLVRALQSDYVRALDYYGKALKEFEATSNKIEMARALTLIGNVHYRQGRYDSALESYRKALALREAMDDKLGQGDTLAGIGSTLLRQKNYSEALDSFQRALVLFEAVGNQDRTAETLTRVSEAFLLQNDYAKALSAADSATGIATKLDNHELLWYARTLAGKAHWKLERLPLAHQAFTAAISTVESLRTAPSIVTGGEHNSTLPYLSAIDFLISQHRPAEAFHYAEGAKVQQLIDLLSNGGASTQKGLSTEERLEEQRLAGQVASIEIQLEREGQQRTGSEARRADLRNRLRQARATHVNFRQQLFSVKPGLRIGRGQFAPLRLDEIRALINDTSTALLQYAITENNTYLFVLTADKGPNQTSTRKRAVEINLKVYPLEIRHQELSSSVSNFEHQITSRADNFQQAAGDLYDLLVKPAEDQIALKTKLVIVPDGILWRLPFEALQSAKNHYLIDQMQVSYAPSFSALREMRKQRLPRGRLNSLLVAYASPALSKDFSARVELAYGGTRLQASAEQAVEAREAATTYGTNASRLFVGAEASEERMKEEVSRTRILHFATPALLDETSPMSSFIGLSSSSSQQDGFLQAREVVDLQTSAELVVLSGSQRHGDLNGGASIGFSWSWFVAGSPATMLSRWRVDSPAQSTVLSKFYFSMKPTIRTHVSRARMLQQSILALRRSADYQHPYYWANFALIGDAR
jgi:CHAT domain-containing protein/tetratricopeptide (TPR) repeat protein